MAAGSDAPVEDGDVVLRPHAAADVDELARLADDRELWRNVRAREDGAFVDYEVYGRLRTDPG